MNQSLKKMLLFRYKPVLIFLSIIILGIYFLQTINGITSWRSNYSYFQSEEAKQDFNRQIKDSYEFEDMNIGKVFLYYNLETEQSIYTDDFNKYKDYSLTVFNSKKDANQHDFHAYSYYNENFLFLLIIFASSGVLLFLFDLKSNFTATLFSSKFKRSDIYRQKIILIGSTLAISLLLGKAISFICYHISIPSQYFNISVQQHLLSTLSGWLTLVAIFMISSFIGLLFGDWLFGLGTIIVLFFTFSTFLTNIHYIYEVFFVDESANPYIFSTTTLNGVIPISQASTLKLNITPLVILILSAFLTYYLGKYLFGKISLEQSGEVFLIPKFSRFFQIFAIIYGVVITTGVTIITTLFPSEPLQTYEIALNCLIIIVSLVGYYLLSEFLLFNKKSKIINRLNFFT